jgi:hypothetical protein
MKGKREWMTERESKGVSWKTGSNREIEEEKGKE